MSSAMTSNILGALFVIGGSGSPISGSSTGVLQLKNIVQKRETYRDV
jgi:hypothetical protein